MFLVDGSPDDLQHGRGVKVLPHQGRQHQREEYFRKLFNGKLLCEGVGPDLGIILQHHTQGFQNVPPGSLHLLFAVGSILPDKAQRRGR